MPWEYTQIRNRCYCAATTTYFGYYIANIAYPVSESAIGPIDSTCAERNMPITKYLQIKTSTWEFRN
jgi:hypothetical protein